MSPINYGNYSESRSRQIYQSDIKSISISSPTSGSENGAPVYVTYILESDIEASAATIQVNFSTNSGSTYNLCTPLATDSLHDGITSLTASESGTSHVFVWDSATDLTTAFISDTVNIQIRATDQNSAVTEYATSSIFTVDMLPGAVTLISPADGFFDSDTTPDFIWDIPADPGADLIAFCIEIDDSTDFSSINIQHESQGNLGRFMHRISTSPGTKNAAYGQTDYIKGYSVTAASTAVTYASLINHHTDLAVDTTLTNPQILLLNRADRRCFILPSTITATGFTIQRSSFGIDANGLVDIIIFSGATLDSYWVDLTGISSGTAYTYGVAPFHTDLLSQAIPGTITNCRPLILEGNDCPVYISSVSNTGFTLNLSNAKVDSTATVRVCLGATPTAAYIHTAKTTSVSAVSIIDTDADLDDSTNGAANWPAYIPGHILHAQSMADRLGIYSAVDNDSIGAYKSSAGIAANAIDDLHSYSEVVSSVPYWTDIPPLGVPDSFEGNQARYRVAAADALAQGFWAWRVRGANIT